MLFGFVELCDRFGLKAMILLSVTVNVLNSVDKTEIN